MYYRTKTYLAGDWTGDSNAIETLKEWNRNKYLTLSFVDAHDFKSARDTSLNCTIKASLKQRMDMSKTFVLIVGSETKSLRAGSCRYCCSLNSYSHYCTRGHNVDYRSYIEYECDLAIKAGIRIVVLYNSTVVNRSKCPDAVRYYGTHIPMKCFRNGNLCWDYESIKKSIN